MLIEGRGGRGRGGGGGGGERERERGGEEVGGGIKQCFVNTVIKLTS